MEEGKLQSQAESPGWSLRPRRVFGRKYLGGFWSCLLAAKSASQLQITLQSLCILQNAHRPAKSMTESSTNSFYRVSHVAHGASASKGQWDLVARSLLSLSWLQGSTWAMTTLFPISCRNTSRLMGSSNSWELEDLGSCPGYVCFLFAESSAPDFLVGQGL